MKKIYRKLIIGCSVVLPVAGTITYIAFSASRNNNQNANNENLESAEKTKELENTKENNGIFPKLNQSTFYDYLVLKEGKPIITSKLISKVVKHVITRINTTNEKVSWSYKLSNDKTKCFFYFEAKEDEKTYKKEYFFDVTMI